jgi:hypothetical protein
MSDAGGVTREKEIQLREQVTEAPQDVAREAGGQAQQAGDQVKDAATGQQPKKVTSELKDVVREAALEMLSPVARKATSSAAKYAVSKGPELVKRKMAPRVADAGGPMELAKKAGGGVGGVMSKLPKVGGDAGAAPSGTGRGRRLPVQDAVALPAGTRPQGSMPGSRYPRGIPLNRVRSTLAQGCERGPHRAAAVPVGDRRHSPRRERLRARRGVGLPRAERPRARQLTSVGAMIRATFRRSKNSGAGSVLACTLTKPSVASWFPGIAASSCCSSGGGGRSCAKSSVNS